MLIKLSCNSESLEMVSDQTLKQLLKLSFIDARLLTHLFDLPQQLIFGFGHKCSLPSCARFSHLCQAGDAGPVVAHATGASLLDLRGWRDLKRDSLSVYVGYCHCDGPPGV